MRRAFWEEGERDNNLLATILLGVSSSVWAQAFIFAKLSFMVAAGIEDENRRFSTANEQGEMALILLKKNTLHSLGRRQNAKKLAASAVLPLEN